MRTRTANYKERKAQRTNNEVNKSKSANLIRMTCDTEQNSIPYSRIGAFQRFALYTRIIFFRANLKHITPVLLYSSCYS